MEPISDVACHSFVGTGRNAVQKPTPAPSFKLPRCTFEKRVPKDYLRNNANICFNIMNPSWKNLLAAWGIFHETNETDFTDIEPLWFNHQFQNGNFISIGISKVFTQYKTCVVVKVICHLVKLRKQNQRHSS